MKRLFYLFSLLFFLASCQIDKAPEIRAAEDLLTRIAPQYAGQIRFEMLADSTDVFEWESDGDRLVIRGNSALSLTAGLGRYLRDSCHSDISWHAFDPIQLPETLPRVTEKVRMRARVDQRFFLNYCTTGYTMPWWKWEDWERLIDWMALEGINMPLAMNGQEAVWQQVWRQHGLSDEEIRSYFTGPAHLPWHRMCNIDAVDGPLPQSWIDAQVQLQQQILARERELGMTPVLPAFGGHVPGKLKEIYPDAPITDIKGWAGFDAQYLPHFLAPTSELYARIQREFIEAQTALFGTDHMYGMDLFNEVEAPTWEPETLAAIAGSAYASLAAADPEARWLQMGWMFHYDREHWTPENVKAYLEAVPQGKVILLDYYTEHTPVWTLTESFYGQPYIFCYLGNFGGNTRIAGPFEKLSERLATALSEGGDNLTGIGATLEGFGVNQWMYEYLFDHAWEEEKALSLPRKAADRAWLAHLADRRIGSESPTNRALWQDLADSCYVWGAISEGPLICGRPCLEGWWHWTVIHDLRFDNAVLGDILDRLLAENSTRDSYRFDVINITCQYLGNRFAELRDAFSTAYRAGDLTSAREEAARMKALLTDVDELAACEAQFRLDRWINDAAAFGQNDAEIAYYERNARHIVSTWGFHKQIKDYASRLWSGLISSYYAPRWGIFLDAVLSAMEEGRPFSQEAVDRQIDAFEERWVAGDIAIRYAAPREDWKKFATVLRERWQ